MSQIDEALNEGDVQEAQVLALKGIGQEMRKIRKQLKEDDN